jgi:hypothetical protein
MSPPKFRPMDENFLMYLQEQVSNGSQEKKFLQTISKEQASNAS